MSGATARIPVRVAGREEREYEIRLEPGLRHNLGERCRDAVPAHRYALVSDSQVARLYGRELLDSFGVSGYEADLFEFPAGEWNKTRREWAGLSDRLLREGFGRDSVVVAVGGGVTGDLAGFLAATYMRGIPVIQVPTTLLAMLDSSVGGKTGVDTERGKNLVGAFHHPARVFVDVSFLETLPRFQIAAGLAEAVKTAAILDAELFEWLERRAADLLTGDPLTLARLIARVVEHKARVVGRDPTESGIRAILNFGHTVGHALELLGGYEILHGEAIAAGMRSEARLGELLEVTRPGTAARLEEALAACELDRQLESERPAEEVWRAAETDKKMRGGTIRCVLLHRIGEVAQAAAGVFTHEISPEIAPVWHAALRSGVER
ncbi:MAG: 3-dehydroquinate synthase [Gemmatimonadota bacterium]